MNDNEVTKMIENKLIQLGGMKTEFNDHTAREIRQMLHDAGYAIVERQWIDQLFHRVERFIAEYWERRKEGPI